MNKLSLFSAAKAAVLVTGFAVAAHASAAVPSTTLYSSVSLNGGTPTTIVEYSGSANAALGTAGSGPYATSQTAFGINRTLASSTKGNSASSDSVWFDQFTAGSTATKIRVTTAVNGIRSGAGAGGEFDWVTYKSYRSVADLIHWVDVNGDPGVNISDVLGAGAMGLAYVNLDPLGSFSATYSSDIALAAGESIYIAGMLGVSVDDDGLMDYAHSAHFGVTVLEGSLRSASGTSYPSSVPEPGILALMFSALGVMGTLLRRRKS